MRALAVHHRTSEAPMALGHGRWPGGRSTEPSFPDLVGCFQVRVEVAFILDKKPDLLGHFAEPVKLTPDAILVRYTGTAEPVLLAESHHLDIHQMKDGGALSLAPVSVSGTIMASAVLSVWGPGPGGSP
jgi:hypothetical protein